MFLDFLDTRGSLFFNLRTLAFPLAASRDQIREHADLS